jgi:PAS domain S-box-containing protein
MALPSALGHPSRSCTEERSQPAGKSMSTKRAIILSVITLSLLLYFSHRAGMLLMPAGRFSFLVSLAVVGLASSLATLFCLRKITYQRLLSLAIAWREWLLRPVSFLSAHHLVKQFDGRFSTPQIDKLLKSAQEERRRSEERFQIIADNAPVMLWVSNENGAVTFTNKPCSNFTGRTPVHEVDKFWVEHVHAEDVQRFLQNFLSASQARHSFQREYRLKRMDGEYRWILDRGVPQFDANGTFAGYVCSAVDVTDYRQAEKALRESELRNRVLVENTTYAIYLSDEDDKLLDVNPALVKMLGYDSAAELLAMNMTTGIFRNPEDAARLAAQCKLQGRLDGFDAEWKRKGGKPITVRLSGRAVSNSPGSLAYLEVIAEDVTERRTLEEQLRQAQKMEAVGRLAGGVAHDFNNLLNLIIGYSALLLGSIAAGDPIRKRVEEIDKAAQRAASLTRQLLAFSRKQVLEPKVLNVNTVVEELDKMLRRLIGEHINLVTVLSPFLGRVKADPSQIEQVIMNLAVNARDAMPRGGKLVIETANVYLDEQYAHKHAGLQPGPYVMLAVRDVGSGMNPETVSHIFEPFFTTKPKGKGTGLGLAMVYGVVIQSGGHVAVESKLGKGSSFKVYLPRVESVVPAEALPPAEALKGSETILLVEDEEPVRRLACEILQASGYTILEASGGLDALQVCETHGRIELMVTDVVMPGMSGRELADELSSLRPEMRVLYVSGYTEDAIGEYGVLEEGVNFLQKPFRPCDLARKVREVLDAGRVTLAPSVEKVDSLLR